MDYLTDTTHEQRVATVKYIQWHRAFIRSSAEKARIPNSQWRETMTREEAQQALWGMINRAINGKAGMIWPKKSEWQYQTSCRRDQRNIQEKILRRVRMYQLETRAARTRFAHLLSSYTEE